MYLGLYLAIERLNWWPIIIQAILHSLQTFQSAEDMHQYYHLSLNTGNLGYFTLVFAALWCTSSFSTRDSFFFFYSSCLIFNSFLSLLLSLQFQVFLFLHRPSLSASRLFLTSCSLIAASFPRSYCKPTFMNWANSMPVIPRSFLIWCSFSAPCPNSLWLSMKVVPVQAPNVKYWVLAMLKRRPFVNLLWGFYGREISIYKWTLFILSISEMLGRIIGLQLLRECSMPSSSPPRHRLTILRRNLGLLCRDVTFVHVQENLSLQAHTFDI